MNKEDWGKSLTFKIKELLEQDPKMMPKRICGVLKANGWKNININSVRAIRGKLKS